MRTSITYSILLVIWAKTVIFVQTVNEDIEEELPSMPTLAPIVKCFEICKCRGTIVVCEDLMLTTTELRKLVKKMSNNLEFLYLSNNKLTDFPLNILGRFKDLREIYLRRNKLTRVPDHKDGELRKLKILDLEDNQITALSESDFKGYGGLHSLYLNRNNIALLKNDTVFKYLVHLRQLLLDDNYIKVVPGLILRYLTDLNLISFSSNAIEELQPRMFDGLHYLKDVLFHNNKLQTIPDYLFSKNKLLTFIDLSSNRIDQLPYYGFANMSNIGKVNVLLSNNHLRTLPKTTFQNSKELYVSLDENMFHCDCNLLATINKIHKDTNHVIGGECTTPLPLETYLLSALTHADIGCTICDVYECENNGTCKSTRHQERKLTLDSFCECKKGFSGRLCQTYKSQLGNDNNWSKEEKKGKDISLSTWIAIGVSVFVLICVVSIAVFFYCKKRKHPNAYLIEDVDEMNEL